MVQFSVTSVYFCAVTGDRRIKSDLTVFSPVNPFCPLYVAKNVQFGPFPSAVLTICGIRATARFVGSQLPIGRKKIPSERRNWNGWKNYARDSIVRILLSKLGAFAWWRRDH